VGECNVEHTITLDGEQVAVPEGATIADVLEQYGINHIEGTKVGLLRSTSSEELRTDRFVLHTTKGEVELRADAPVASTLMGFEGSAVRWNDGKSLVFGYRPVDIEPSRNERRYERGEVFFATSGFDAEKGMLAFSLRRHSAAYGGSEEGGFGRVIRGAHVLPKLEEGDVLLSVKPVLEVRRAKDFLLTEDLSQEVPEGAMLLTGVSISLLREAPVGAEHVLAALEGHVLTVDVCTSSFVSYDGLQGEVCPFEHLAARRRGAVSVRTEGFGIGRIYISKQDRASSWMHSVVGEVKSGMELLDFASQGDAFTVRLEPERLSIYGRTFVEAERLAGRRGVVLERDGYIEDDGIIVDQNPHTTIEVVEGGKVRALGVPPSKVLDVHLYRQEAPKSIKYLSRALGMAYRPIGEMSVVFTYENTILMKPESAPDLELIPEHTPTDVVEAGEIGLTNQAAKRKGIFGIKLVDDTKYGPTGEKFHATNIVARVSREQLHKLHGLRQGDVLYIREEK